MAIKKNNPTQNQVHANTPLRNISIAYVQSAEGFIANQIAPDIGVDKQSDTYYKYTRADFNRIAVKKRADATETPGIGYSVSTDNYFCDVFGLHHDIGKQRESNTDSPLDADRDATRLLTGQLLMKKELDMANTYFATGVWGTDVTGVSATPNSTQVLQWNDASSTPIEDLRKYKRNVQEATGMMPKYLGMGSRVWDALMDHPELIDRVKYGQTQGPVTDELIRSALTALLGLKGIYVSEAIQNTAAEGATEANSHILGKSALLYFKPPKAGLRTPSAAYSFSWNGYLGAAGLGQRVKRMDVPLKEARRIEAEMAYDFKVTGTDLGVLFASLVA